MGVPNLKNRVGMTVTGTPGTGTITLNAADTGYQSFATAYGANANVDVLIVEGSAWEVARDCTYTHSGTTLSRGTLEASSTGSALSLTSAAKVYVTETAERMRRGEMGYLEHSSHDGSAAVTGVVGTLHVFTGLTADRDFTLPATAAEGDRVGVTFPVGSASYEILLKSATGDKINNVVSSTTEWSRLFMAGETVIFRCIDGSTVDWVVEYDGRIPQSAFMAVTTAPDGETAATFTRPTLATSAGAWTVVTDNASLCSTSGDSIKTRRTGLFSITYLGVSKDALAADKAFTTAVYKNGTTQILSASTQVEPAGGGVVQAGPNCNNALTSISLTTDDYLVYLYRSEEGAKGLAATALPRIVSGFGISEVF